MKPSMCGPLWAACPDSSNTIRCLPLVRNNHFLMGMCTSSPRALQHILPPPWRHNVSNTCHWPSRSVESREGATLRRKNCSDKVHICTYSAISSRTLQRKILSIQYSSTNREILHTWHGGTWHRAVDTGRQLCHWHWPAHQHAPLRTQTHTDTKLQMIS